ncbi:MAG: sulfotransferase [Proteobacteria bacterium]|nr:sulfotransferase [Pseudomonadota bacterium]
MNSSLAELARAAEARLAQGHRDAHDANVLAWHRHELGDVETALALLNRALEWAPDDPGTLTSLATMLRGQGRLRDAVLHCDAAIRADPGFADAWLERAYVLASGGSMAGARESYARVVALVPGHPAGHAGLASLAARDGEHQPARQHAEAALRADPGNPIAVAALATVELEAGAPDRARALIAPVLARMAGASAESALLANLLGDALARLGDPAAAFAAYCRSNDDFLAVNADRFGGRPAQRMMIEQAIAGLGALHPAGWDKAPGDDPRRASPHLFLCGYPRSGNTLAENILASIPGVAAIEERPTMAEADHRYLAPAGGMAALEAASAEELAEMRGAYWARVAGAGVESGGRPLVDMDPLKSLRLPLIARLFPAATVVLTRRDPRDVVWSCFHTHFALSNAALEFTTLEGAARHYDAVMRLTEASMARLPLAVHVLDYHRLVGDFEHETRALCAATGLAWSEDLRRFDRTAKARGVSTASAGQVRKGLYDGRRQWEAFADQLAPVLPILAPWIEKFGYS